MMIRFLLPAALALAAVSGLGALTVDDAVTQARAHNLGLQTEALKLAQKADEKNFSFDRLYPSLTVNAGLARLNEISFSIPEALWPYIRNDAAIPYPGDLLTDDNQWNLALGASVQFLWSPAVFRGMGQTVVDYQNAVVSRDAAAAKLDRDVRKAFAQLLALHEATALFESQLKVAEDRYRLAKVNFEAGLGSEISVLQAQAAWEAKKPALADQKLNEENARAAFKMLLNLPSDADLTLEGSLTVTPEARQALATLDPDTLVKRYASGRWDVLQARGAAASLKNLSALQGDTLLPSLVFGWSADPTVNAPFKDSAWKDWDNYAQRSGALTLGVAWKLDGLLPGSTTQLQIQNLARQAQQAELGAQQAQRAGEVEIRSLAGKLKKSASSLESLQLSLDLAVRSSKLTESGYKAGTQSFNDAQDADLQAQGARLQFLNEQLTFQAALADLDYALNAGKKDWLHG